MLRSDKQENIYNLIALDEPFSPITEMYRGLQSNIQFSSIDQQIKCLGVTSSIPAEGKTTTIANLAVVYAQNGKRTLLIDTDLRKPKLHYIFKCLRRIGISSYMTGQRTLLDSIQSTNVLNLDLLAAGAHIPNPFEMISSQKMQAMLEQLKQEYDIILMDLAPVLAVSDTQVLASYCDGILLVMHSGKVKREEALKTKDLLERSGTKIIGTVVNRVPERDRKINYYYYYGSDKE